MNTKFQYSLTFMFFYFFFILGGIFLCGYLIFSAYKSYPNTYFWFLSAMVLFMISVFYSYAKRFPIIFELLGNQLICVMIFGNKKVINTFEIERIIDSRESQRSDTDYIYIVSSKLKKPLMLSRRLLELDKMLHLIKEKNPNCKISNNLLN